MKELGENAPVYTSLPSIKNYQTAKQVCLGFGLKKWKTEHFSYQFRAISSFFIYSMPGTEEEKKYLLLLLTVVVGKEGYQAWQEFCWICRSSEFVT